MRRLVSLALLSATVTMAILAAAAWWLSGKSTPPPRTAVRSTGEASIGGPFQLVDHTGRRVTDNVDHTTVIYFMGPDGKYLTQFRHDAGGTAMAERMRGYLPRS